MDYKKLAGISSEAPQRVDARKLTDSKRKHSLKEIFEKQQRIDDGLGKTFHKSLKTPETQNNSPITGPSQGKVFKAPKSSTSPKNNTPITGPSQGKVFKNPVSNNDTTTQVVVDRVKSLGNKDRKTFYKELMDSIRPLVYGHKITDSVELYSELSKNIDRWIVNKDQEAHSALTTSTFLKEFSDEEVKVIRFVTDLETLPPAELSEFVKPLTDKFEEFNVPIPPFVLLKKADSVEDNIEKVVTPTEPDKSESEDNPEEAPTQEDASEEASRRSSCRSYP